MTAKELAEMLLENPDMEVYAMGANDVFNPVEYVEVKPGNVVVDGGIDSRNNRWENVIIIF